MWLHLDYITKRLQANFKAQNKIVRVYGVPECGLFMDENTAEGSPKWTPNYAAVDGMQNVTGSGSANAGCLAAALKANQPLTRCFLAQHSLPHVKTPFYAVNSVYDEWQGSNILALNPLCIRDPAQCTKDETAAYENLRVDMLSNLTSAVTNTNTASAFFTYNCATHCGQFNHDDRWSNLLNLLLRTASPLF